MNNADTTPSSAVRDSSRRPLLLIIVGVIVLLGLYAVSPYFSFWRFTVAVRAGDHEGVASHVDFPALRDSMKRELRARFYPDTPSDKSKKKDRLQAFLQGMAPTLIDTLVDAYITPDGIAALLADPHIALTRPERAGSSAELSAREHSIDWSKVRMAFFTGPRDFVVNSNETKLHFRFSSHGWLLREIDLPEYVGRQ
ncbi:MAG: DUF2939 domain-containing protein [Chthoniobacterales bacterium]